MRHHKILIFFIHFKVIRSNWKNELEVNIWLQFIILEEKKNIVFLTPNNSYLNLFKKKKLVNELKISKLINFFLIEGKKDMPDYEIDHAAKLKAVKDANK